MKVAITGAGGYVGGMLVRAHAGRGDAVQALARDPAAIPAAPGVTRVAADLRQPEAIPDSFFEHADVMYHCAAELYDNTLMHAVNVEGTRALLARARGRVGHWVQVSSLSVYGAMRSGVITEESAPRPASRYAATKAEADALVATISQGSFSHTIVRPPGVLGPHMRNRSMYALIDAVRRGRFAFIGPPGAIGNYVHEENIVAALFLCATRREAQGRTYNVAQTCAMEQMIATIASALGVAIPRARIPEPLAHLGAQVGRVVPGFPLTPGRVDALTRRVEYPSRRIESELGYSAGKSIADGLRELVALRGEPAR